MLYSLIFILSTFLFTISAHAGNSTNIPTYHHSPAGVYEDILLLPRPEISDAECTADSIGLMYVDEDSNNTLKACQDYNGTPTWGPIIGIWKQNGTNPISLYPSSNETDDTVTTLVGIGTTSPQFKLHMTSDGGILAQGEYNSGLYMGNPGAGTRFVWYPRKAALRAGQVSDIGGDYYWDENYIGDSSFATGLNTIAGNDTISSKNYQTAMGNTAEASGSCAFASGLGTIASGDYSTAIGANNTAVGFASVALGENTLARGDHSLSMGLGTIAPHFHSISLGKYNYFEDLGLPGNILGQAFYNDNWTETGKWAPYNHLFTIGDGSDDANRSNIFRVYSCGAVGIGNRQPPFSVLLDVNGDDELGAMFIGRDPAGGNDATEEVALKLGRYNDATAGSDIYFDDSGVIAADDYIYINSGGKSNLFSATYFGSNSPTSTSRNDENILLYINENMKVGVGTTSQGALPLLISSGCALNNNGDWLPMSTIDNKEKVTALTYNEAFDLLNQLEPVVFNYIDGDKKQFAGFIAEDVPDLVASRDRKGISSTDIIATITKVVQHQQNDIKFQEESLKDQQREIEELNNILNNL